MVTLESIMECVIPFLMAMLIDYGIDGNNGAGDMGYIWKMGLILIGCTVVTLLFGALAGKTAAEASAGYAKNLRHDPLLSCAGLLLFQTSSAFPPPASSPA